MKPARAVRSEPLVEEIDGVLVRVVEVDDRATDDAIDAWLRSLLDKPPTPDDRR